MTRACLAPRDIGPEFERALARVVLRDTRALARRFDEISRAAPDCRTAAERIKTECDRLLTLSDVEVGHVATP